jgi:uridine phosphorylase
LSSEVKCPNSADAYFNPSDFRAYFAKRLGKPESYLTVPSEVLFTYDRRIFSAATSVATASPVDWYIYSGRLFTRHLAKRDIGVVHALIGASAAAMNLEELIAYGAKRVFEVGVSGSIDTRLNPGDVVVLDGAISDEGTSKHYYQDKDDFSPSTKLTERLKTALKSKRISYVIGKAWTTDAPYRETKDKVAAQLARGARVVNMESSAIFAVASYRGIETASVQVISDVVSETWEPAFHTEVVNEGRMKVLDAVLAAANR